MKTLIQQFKALCRRMGWTVKGRLETLIMMDLKKHEGRDRT